MAEMVQMLCGTVNVWDEDRDGIKTLRPHELQLSEGVCACGDPEAWARLTASMPPHYGGLLGDADWPVHTWWTSMPEKTPPSGPADVKAIKAEKAAGPCGNPECPECGHLVVPAVEESGHPAPVVTALDPIPAGKKTPAVVTALKEQAEALGWSVNLTYARGRGIHGTTGKPTKEVDSWALRCWQGERRAVAVYSGESWGDMWGVADMFHARTKEQFAQYLAGVDEAWLRRTRALNLEFEAYEACTSNEVHAEHPWWKKKVEGRWCNGRTEAKVKKSKESGG
jgi:hypothetical protein